MTDAILETHDLTCRFGALAAVDRVSVSVRPGEVHALIGPNGAGKSTLLDLLSGNRAPSSGQIRFRGRRVEGLPSHRVARLGIGRSYQRTNLFPGLTCEESVSLAAQARLPGALRLFRSAALRRQADASAARALELCGLAGRAREQSLALSYGEQRQLEIGMLLATDPQLLLLDEPLAGMGRDEATAVVLLVRRLAETRTVVLVEHDMDAIFSLAQTLTVLVDGRVLESGPPERVRASRAVQEAYLGGEGA